MQPATHLHLAYVVSRFPLVTETFILREFDRVARLPGTQVELYSLFSADTRVVHDEARPWMLRLQRATPARAVRAAARWLREDPAAVGAIFGRVVRDNLRSPRVLGKAVITTLAAFQHAWDMRARGVTHVHAHFATYPALAAWVIKRLTGIRYTVTPHAHDIFVDQTGLRARLEGAERVVAVSRYNWMFLQHFGATPERLERISYGLDLESYSFRSRPMPGTGPVRALMVSSFRESKGHAYLLQALVGSPSLARVEVEFVGTGPLFSGIQALAERLGLAERCAFSGSRDQVYVRDRLASADMLIQPSVVASNGDTEGLPNTLLEAAACGVTMVASRVTGIPELVEEGVTGFLAEPRSPESLAAALERALGAGAAVEELQRSARARVEMRHDLARTATTLRRLFYEVQRQAEQERSLH